MIKYIDKGTARQHLTDRLMESALNNFRVRAYVDDVYVDLIDNRLPVWLDELQTYDVQETRWIPVTERLPEERGSYLVTVVDGTIKRAIAQWLYDYCDNGEGFFVCDDGYAEDIVAWMPLPEPYKGGEQE